MASTNSTTAGVRSSVVVAGATGAIGREFVTLAVADDFFSRVVALSRRDIPADMWAETWPGIDLNKAKEKLKVFAMDWEGLCDPLKLPTVTNAAEALSGHQYAVNLMGSTRKDAGSAAAFHRYDFDYFEAYANAVKHFNPPLAGSSSAVPVSSVSHFHQISSGAASASSWFPYLKTKGLADEMLMKKGYFGKVSLWRPSVLQRKDKARAMEKFLSIFLPSMPVDRVAAAIMHDLKTSEGFNNSEEGKKLGEIGMCEGAPAEVKTRIYTDVDIKQMTPQFTKKGCCDGSKSDV